MNKVLNTVAVISVLVVIALAVINLTVKARTEPDAVYPMTNQHIDWTYAGK